MGDMDDDTYKALTIYNVFIRCLPENIFFIDDHIYEKSVCKVFLPGNVRIPPGQFCQVLSYSPSHEVNNRDNTECVTIIQLEINELNEMITAHCEGGPIFLEHRKERMLVQKQDITPASITDTSTKEHVHVHVIKYKQC